jgi:hypothetical protein
LKRALKFVIPSGLIIGGAIVSLTAFMQAGTWSSTQSHTGTMVLLSITSLWVLVLHARPLRGIRLVILTGMLALCIATFAIAPLAKVLGFTVLELDKLGWVLALAVAANALVSITQALVGKGATKLV